jgi:bacterioferritin-associated ferredoxin
MIVCLCRAVPEHAVHAAVASGAGSLPELAAACRGAGTDCGACQGMLTAMLEAACSGVRCAVAATS